MCGIAGVLRQSNSTVPSCSEILMAEFSSILASRGPDSAGFWRSPGGRMSFVQRRLRILDLDTRADGPMHSSDGRYCLVFNGEIYNFRELRSELEQRGYRFLTTSDTEVLLHMFMEFGVAMLPRLRGMYAFAIWDELEQKLTIARDPLGIKPFYYAEGDGNFYFASEVKALLQAPGVDLREQPAGHVGFFVWGSIPEPYTLYRGIYSCPSGTYIVITLKSILEPRSFYSLIDETLDFEKNTLPKSQDESLARLHDALQESVRFHLISDTPAAIFLSAGIDSGVITALAGESRHDIQCLTLGTDRTRNTPLDETGLASVVARTYGLPHYSRFIDQATFSSECDRMVDYMDQPTIDGVNVYFISWLARQCGFKVALSGLGGDELFGGYPSFTQIPATVHALGFTRSLPFLGRAWRAFSAKALGRWTSPKYASLFEYGGTYGGAYLLRRGLYMPWELPAFLDPDLVREGWRELASVETMNAFIQPLDHLQPGRAADFLRVSALEIRNYMRTQLLRDSDWAGMAHSLEVRVPMVDTTLLRQIAPLRASRFSPRKPSFVAALKTPLPGEILNRPKTGFALPVREWMQENQTVPLERGLRGWAKYIYHHFQTKNAAHGAAKTFANNY